MAQKTNLNVTPYYDDFEEGDNFHKVLYRPGFAVQARELTSQQSILQNQIEKMGRNIFKEGAVISGGEVGLDKKYYAVKVQGTFNTTDVTSNISSYVNKVITGASSGVSALVVGTADAAGDDPITLFVKYLNPDNTGDVTTFTDGENLSANGVVGSFIDGQESLTVDTSNATATGSAVTVASGTYFVRGYFVNVSEQTLVLDKYSNTPSYRVGFTVTEDLVTPEEDGTLFDNATGTSNENAAGAHRLKITLTLSKLGLTETNDTNFVELMRINLGNTLSAARPTEYAVLGDTLARRTYDESGHYVVRDFRPDIRESLNDGVNNGVFDAGSITDDGATTSDDLLAIHLTPGKAYVAGYEVEKNHPTFVDLPKPRTTENVDSAITPIEVGNTVKVSNAFNSPDVTPEISGKSVPYNKVLLHDTFTNSKLTDTAAGPGRGIQTSSIQTNGGHEIGVARVRSFGFDEDNSAVDDFLSNSADNDSQFNVGLFDIKMFTELQLSGTPGTGQLGTSPDYGTKVTGANSGAIGFVHDVSGVYVYLTNVSGIFSADEKLKSTSCTASDELVDDNATPGSGADLTITAVKSFDIGSVKQMFMTDGFSNQVDFSADCIQESRFNLSGSVSLSRNSNVLSGTNTLFNAELRVGDVIEVPTGSGDGVEKIVIESVTDNTTATYYCVEGGKVSATSATSHSGGNASFRSNGAFTASSGTVLSGSGSRTVIFKNHAVNGYNGRATITFSTNDIVTYSVNTTITSPDTATPGDVDIVLISNDVSLVPAVRTRTKINDTNKNILLRKTTKKYAKSMLTEDNNGVSQTSFTFQRQFITTSNSGAVSITCGSNETFNAIANSKYTISVLDNGSGSGCAAGDVIDITGMTSTALSGGNQTATFTDATVFDTDDIVVKITATITATTQQQKNKTNNPCNLVLVDNDGIAGGAEYGSSAHHHEISLGRPDYHRIRAIYESVDNSTDPKVPQFSGNISTGTFLKGERIKGDTSGALGELITTGPTTFHYVLLSTTDFSNSESFTGQSSGATGTVTTVTAGDNVVTSDYVLDDGMRDSFYDISRIVRKAHRDAPVGKLLIVGDFFSHSAGAFFTVDSYSTIDYDDIPVYTATRIDTEQRQPRGRFLLHDAIDFRPTVANSSFVSATTSTQSLDADKVDSFSFSFNYRNYTGTGAVVVNIPEDNSNFQYDLDFYVGRKDSLFLTKDKEFILQQGLAAELELAEFPKELSEAEGMKIADIELQPYVKDSEQDVKMFLEKNGRYTMRDIGRLENRIQRLEDYTTLNLLEAETENFQVVDANGLNRFKSGFVVDNFSGHKTGDVTHQDYSCAIDYENKTLRPKYSMKNVSLTEQNTNSASRALDGYKKTGDFYTLPYEDEVSVENKFASQVESLQAAYFFAWTGVLNLDPSGDEWFEVNKIPSIVINEEGNFDQILQAAGGEDVLGTIWNSWQTVNSFVSGTTTRGPGRGGLWEQVLVDQIRTGTRTLVTDVFNHRVVGTELISRDIVPFIRSRNVVFRAQKMKPKTRVYPFFDRQYVGNFCVPDTGKPGGTLTEITLPETPNWTSIGKIRFGYDNTDQANDYVAEILSSDSEYGFNTVGQFSRHQSIDIPAGTAAIYEYEWAGSIEGPLTPNVYGEKFIRIQVSRKIDPIHTCAGHRLFAVELFDTDGTTSIDLQQFGSVVQFQNLINPSAAINDPDATEPQEGAVTPGNVGRQEDMRDSVLQFTMNIFTGPRTLEPESGKNLKLLPPGEDGSVFITGPTGKISGVFNIPDPNAPGNPAFKTGERLFRLTSSRINEADNVNLEGVETYAQAIYEARGFLNTVEETVTRTRNGEVWQEEVFEARQLSRRGRTLIQPWDPLAQSFLVDSVGGEFITKVDLFFQQVDDRVPVTVMIREMVDGYPTEKMLPLASKTLEPEEISISEDGSVPTTFVFEAPIYVQEHKEYALVIKSDSREYNIFISKLGNADIDTGTIINDQPYLGVLFKSQNNRTWNAYQDEDIKFTLYRAKFDTSKTSNLVLVNEPVEERTLKENPIEALASSQVMKVNHRNHHMYQSSNNVKISGVTSGVTTTLAGAITDASTTLTLTSSTGFPSSGSVRLKIDRPRDSLGRVQDPEIFSGTISGTVVSSITRPASGAVAHAAGAGVELYQVQGVPLDQINRTHTSIGNINMDSYTITTANTAAAEGVTATTAASATASEKFGGKLVKASENSMMDVMKPFVANVEYPGTRITSRIRTTTARSPSGTQTSFNLTAASSSRPVALGRNYYFDVPRMVCSAPNEENELNSSKSFFLTCTMSSEHENLSPVIDLDKSSIATITHRMDNITSSSDVYPTESFVEATEPEGDSLEAIYLTRQVQLKTPANQLNVKLDAVRHSSANIDLMFKVLRTDDSSDFNDIGYTYFNGDGSTDVTTNSSTTRDDFIEHEYSAKDLEDFTAFQIKIRMRGTDTTNPPIIKRLRVVATG